MQMALFELPTVKVPDRIGRAGVAKARSRSVLTPGRGRLAAYDYAINPYIGCAFGCSYCYAAFFVEGPKRDCWGEWVEAKTGAIGSFGPGEVRDKRIYMSSATDPYQPLEDQMRLTRQILEVLVAGQARLVVQTRSPLVTRDIDLLRELRHVRVNLSITTDDDEVRRRYEPSCASIERRLEAAQRLIDAEIKVNVCISPMLPMRYPAGFADRLQAMGVNAVTTSFFHDDAGDYAAGTRPEARRMAAEDRWGEAEFRAARSVIHRRFPDSGRAFAPE